MTTIINQPKINNTQKVVNTQQNLIHSNAKTEQKSCFEQPKQQPKTQPLNNHRQHSPTLIAQC